MRVSTEWKRLIPGREKGFCTPLQKAALPIV